MDGDAVVLWAHDTQSAYGVPRHTVAPMDGVRWAVVQERPLSVLPSLHCSVERGGCGAHIVITNGHA